MGGSTLERHSGHRISLQLTRDCDAPGAARHALDAIDHRLDREREYSVRLLLSELVSNAVKYGGEGPVIVEIESSAGCVRGEADDRGPACIPVTRKPGHDTVGGWGSVRVDQRAARRGSS